MSCYPLWCPSRAPPLALLGEPALLPLLPQRPQRTTASAQLTAVTAALPLGGAVGALAVAGPAHNHGRRSAKLVNLGVGAGVPGRENRQMKCWELLLRHETVRLMCYVASSLEHVKSSLLSLILITVLKQS